MEIFAKKPIEPSAASGKTAKGTNSGAGTAGAGFANLVQQSARPKGGNLGRTQGLMGGTQELAAAETLNAIQSVGDQDQGGGGNKQSSEQPKEEEIIEHGNQLLNEMRELQLQILTGDIDPINLEAIQKRLQSELSKNGEPKLLTLIRNIEVRASIELAKIKRATIDQT